MIMDVNTASKSFIITVHTMGFMERRQSHEQQQKNDVLEKDE